MIGQTELTEYIPWAIALLGGGGVVGAIVAFIKVKPEAGQLVIKAAEGAVVVQSGVIEDLREQLEAQSLRIDLLERDKQAALWEAAKVRAENDLLVQRVKHLEQEVQHLNAQLVREARMNAMEDRLRAEELRNTDIEEFAKRESERQDISEQRADDTEDHA